VELLLQILLHCVERLEDGVNVLQVVLGEGLELLDGHEQVDKFAYSPAEQVELSEDLVG